MPKKKSHKTFKMLVLLIITALFFSQNSLDLIEEQVELDEILTDAYFNGEIDIQPLAPVKSEYWHKQPNSFTLANLISRTTKTKFSGGDDYVLKRLDTGDVYQVRISDNSTITERLKHKPVILEEDQQYIGNDFTQVQENRINNYLKIPQQYRDLLKKTTESIPTIAFVDSGFSHDGDCHDRSKLNLKELNGESMIDDDGNGYIDDYCGWNFLDNNNLVNDLNGHGTHLAGIAMSLSNANLLPLQALDADNRVNLSKLISALTYAIEELNKGDIINLSIGAKSDSAILRNILVEAEQKGILVVASAGNYNEPEVLKPAAYNSVLAVGAVTRFGDRAHYSNYGPEIDYSFIGDALSLSHANHHELIIKQGTSQSAASVSAIIATIKSLQPDMGMPEINYLLHQSGSITGSKNMGTIVDLKKLSELLFTTSSVN